MDTAVMVDAIPQPDAARDQVAHLHVADVLFRTLTSSRGGESGGMTLPSSS
jgi:hypothetical protein